MESILTTFNQTFYENIELDKTAVSQFQISEDGRALFCNNSNLRTFMLNHLNLFREKSTNCKGNFYIDSDKWIKLEDVDGVCEFKLHNFSGAPELDITIYTYSYGWVEPKTTSLKSLMEHQ